MSYEPTPHDTKLKRCSLYRPRINMCTRHLTNKDFKISASNFCSSFITSSLSPLQDKRLFPETFDCFSLALSESIPSLEFRRGGWKGPIRSDATSSAGIFIS